MHHIYLLIAKRKFYFDQLEGESLAKISAKILCQTKGKPVVSKMDEFPENFRRGGGVISDLKKCIAIFFAS